MNILTILIMNTTMFLPKDLINEILQYAIEDKYILHDWVSEKHLNICNISHNPAGVEYTINVLNKINKIRKEVIVFDVSSRATTEDDVLYVRGELLSAAIKDKGIYLSSYDVNPDFSLYDEKFIIRGLCSNINPDALEFIKNNLSLVNYWNWEYLCQNPLADELILDNLELLDKLAHDANDKDGYWAWICLNTSPKIINYLKNNIDKIRWEYLSKNKKAIEILSANLDKLDDECWEEISINKHSVELLSANLDKLNKKCWKWISINKNAIELIKYAIKNKPQLIDWEMLCRNHNMDVYPIILENIDKLNQDCWMCLSGNSVLIRFIKNDKKMMDLMINAMNEYFDEGDYDGWQFIAQNPNAIDIIKANMKKIHIYELANNISREAIEIIKERIGEVGCHVWNNLARNPFAIDLFREYKSRVYRSAWEDLSCNEDIFKNIRLDICSNVMKLCNL